MRSTGITVFAAIWALSASGVMAVPLPQLAGVGAASDSIFTDTDNGVGYGVENAEDNLAGNIGTVKAATPATPARAVEVRQLNKIADGAGAVGNAAGAGAVSGPANTELDNIDTQSTNDAATVGADTGSIEETTLEQAGSDVP